MAPPTLQHRRVHNLLLINKLLNQRGPGSPFTLIFDNLEQSGKPLLADFIIKAKTSSIRVLFVAFETIAKLHDVKQILAWQNTRTWQQQVRAELDATPSNRTLLVFDALNPIVAGNPNTLSSILGSFIRPTVSVVAIYHTDVPEAAPATGGNAYAPSPMALLRYLATTIFTTRSIHHDLACKAARDRSRAEPGFGYEEGIEGVFQGRFANGIDGMVLEMEHRRRSGRGVRERYYFPPQGTTGGTSEGVAAKASRQIILLEDHPSYKIHDENLGPDPSAASAEAESTFELGLTDQQRRDRDDVILPYFDAQKGSVIGGRILYDMGSDDDEEDEI